MLNYTADLYQRFDWFATSNEVVQTKKMTSGFPTSAMAVDSLRLLPPDRSHARLLAYWTRPSRCIIRSTTFITHRPYIQWAYDFLDGQFFNAYHARGWVSQRSSPAKRTRMAFQLSKKELEWRFRPKQILKARTARKPCGLAASEPYFMVKKIIFACMTVCHLNYWATAVLSHKKSHYTKAM